VTQGKPEAENEPPLNPMDGVWNLTEDEYREYRRLFNAVETSEEEEDRLGELFRKIEGQPTEAAP
jgi:hypothetical protein